MKRRNFIQRMVYGALAFVGIAQDSTASGTDPLGIEGVADDRLPFHLSALRLQAGDLLIVKCKFDADMDADMDVVLAGVSRLREWLDDHDREDLEILLLDHDWEISHIAASQMRVMGWVRVESEVAMGR